MNRRSFFGTAISAVGVIGLARSLKFEEVFAAAKGAVKATSDSLKGLPKATGVTAKSFWMPGDNVATVQNFCDGVKGGKACGDKRQPGQFCGSCMFLQNRAVYEGDVVGKCQLIQDKPPKTHVHGHNYCASYVNNPANKYAVK